MARNASARRRSSQRRKNSTRTSSNRRRPSRSSTRTRSTSARRSTSPSVSRRTQRSSARRSSTRSSASRKSNPSSKSYSSIRSQCEQKIQSFQTIRQQTKGGKPQQRPSAATLNRWANWINKGAVVFKMSGQQVARAGKKNKPCATASTAIKNLKQRYGSAIKAVAPAANGGWIVAAKPQSKNFRFPR